MGLPTSLDAANEVAAGELAFIRIVGPVVRPLGLVLACVEARFPELG